MKDCIDIALFGIGRAGRIHIQNVVANPKIRLKYLVEANVQALEAAMDEFELTETQPVPASNQDVVFNDKTIKGIIVASTTFTHEAIVKEALSKGIPIFCEKPIAQTLDSIISCYETARKINGILHCSFNRRFDPSIVEARQRFRKEVGKVFWIKTVSRDSPVPPMDYLKVSGGIFHDCAVHDLDLICWMLGEWPTTVFSVATTVDERIRMNDDHDVVSITLKFSSGVLAHIDLSRISPVGYDQRLEIAGDKGMLMVENTSKDRLSTYNSSGCHKSPIDFSFPQRYRDSYIKSLEHFLNVVNGKENLTITALESINVTKLATICEESCRAGKPLSFEPITSF